MKTGRLNLDVVDRRNDPRQTLDFASFANGSAEFFSSFS